VVFGLFRGTERRPRVFICYRRDDSAGHSGRLYDQLTEDLGPEQVFLDLAGSIDAGADFVSTIEDRIASCDVLLVVIGRSWLTALGDTASTATRRDYVSHEIAVARKHDVRIIPVLVQGARMPEEDEFPEHLRGLARLQAVEIGDRRWQEDVRRLITSIRDATAERRKGAAPGDEAAWSARGTRSRASRHGLVRWAGPVLLLVGAFAIAAYLYDRRRDAERLSVRKGIVREAMRALDDSGGITESRADSSGWIYVGTLVGAEWRTTKAEGIQPARTLDFTHMPARGQTYTVIRGVRLRATLPTKATASDPLRMGEHRGDLAVGTRVTIDQIVPMPLADPERTWIWAFVVVRGA
jgi:hypothetical protein